MKKQYIIILIVGGIIVAIALQFLEINLTIRTILVTILMTILFLIRTIITTEDKFE